MRLSKRSAIAANLSDVNCYCVADRTNSPLSISEGATAAAGGRAVGSPRLWKLLVPLNPAETPKSLPALTTSHEPRRTAGRILGRKATSALPEPWIYGLCGGMHSPPHRKHPNSHLRS